MLRILIVDDEKIIRHGAARIIGKCEPEAEIIVCGTGKEALREVRDEPFDIAFCDIEMPEMDGITLAKRIKKLAPDTNIIFSTAYPQYAGDAMKLHASGYITKPLTAEKVKRELSDLRHPVDDDDKGLRVQTFGNFEVFYNGEPLHFKYNKTKELLAYLVDRNCAMVGSGEIKSALWEDEEGDKTAYFMQLRKDLQDTLASVGEGEAIVSTRGGMGIIPSRIKCDFFDYLSGAPKGINAYRGEYMRQYSWAEVTHGTLEMRDD